MWIFFAEKIKKLLPKSFAENVPYMLRTTCIPATATIASLQNSGKSDTGSFSTLRTIPIYPIS